MGKVTIHTTMSLDGFMAGPNDEMDWVFKYGTDEMVDEVMRATGAVVLGKRTFELSIKKNSLPYGGEVKVPQFVITHESRKPVTRDELTFTFVTDGLQCAIALAKAAAGDKNVSVLGASIAQQCLKARLADEILIHLFASIAR